MALGEDLHSAKAVFAGRHSAKISRGLTASSGVLFAECPRLALGKEFILPSAKTWHSAKYFFLFFATNFFEALVHYYKQHV